MSETLKLSILSPERRLVESILVEEVTLPGSEGQIQILPGHAPMIGTLQIGLFHYRSPGKEVAQGIISHGFFEVKDGEIHVMADSFELRSEIDIDHARQAQKEAEETLQSATLDEHHFKEYQLKLQKAIVRQQVAGHDLH